MVEPLAPCVRTESLCYKKKINDTGRHKNETNPAWEKEQIHVRLCEGKSKQRWQTFLGKRTGERQDSLT